MSLLQIFGLFKGMAPPLAAVAFQNALLFCSYGNILRLFNKRDDGRYAIRHVAFAGAVSGLVQLAVICPTDLVKIKLQMQTEGTVYKLVVVLLGLVHWPQRPEGNSLK